jgi:PPM family protein phosphatase
VTEPSTLERIPAVPAGAPRSEKRLHLRSYGMTNAGRVRARNEDQFLVASLAKTLCIRQSSLAEPNARHGNEQGHLFVVADGMGGAPGGEQASSLAVRLIEEYVTNTLKWFFHLKGPETENVLAEFQSALKQADARLFEETSEHPEFDGMGTTLTLAYNLGTSLFVAHAGDSRCYLCRDGNMTQLTHDHTLAEDLRRKNGGAWAEKLNHRFSHIITNAIGGRSRGVRAEIHRVTIEAGDAVLLATDGLTRELSDDQIGAILAAEKDPQAACERLVAAALDAGGRDNITVIVARFDVPADEASIPAAAT